MIIKRKHPGCDWEMEKQREESLDIINEDNGDKTIEKNEKRRYFIVIKNDNNYGDRKNN